MQHIFLCIYDLFYFCKLFGIEIKPLDKIKSLNIITDTQRYRAFTIENLRAIAWQKIKLWMHKVGCTRTLWRRYRDLNALMGWELGQVRLADGLDIWWTKLWTTTIFHNTNMYSKSNKRIQYSISYLNRFQEFFFKQSMF